MSNQKGGGQETKKDNTEIKTGLLDTTPKTRARSPEKKNRRRAFTTGHSLLAL